jgi:hypothetical protein
MKRLLLALILVFAATVGFGAWYSTYQAATARADRWRVRRAALAAEALLDKPIRVDGRTLTLHEFSREIARQTGLNVSIDEEAVARVHGDYLGTSRQRRPPPYELSLRLPIGPFTARTALDHVLYSTYLDYDFDGSTLIITTQDAAESKLQTVVYPLPQPMLADVTEDEWVELITTAVEPHGWDGVGGPGHIVAVPGALVVVQTPAIHRQLRQFLDGLAGLEQLPDSLEPRVLLWQCDAAARQKLQSALDRSASIACFQRPFRAVVEQIAEEHGIAIAIDADRLEESGVSLEQPVTLELKDVSLRSLLRHLLHMLELALIDRGDALVITTPEQAEEHLQVVAYPVHDLVWTDGLADFDSLIELITTNVSPQSWSEGNNNFTSTLGSAWLILPQTTEVQVEIQSILTRLRAGVAAGGEPAVAGSEPEAAAHDRIRAALRRPTPLDFDQTPLRQVFERLAAELHIQILLDERLLREAGVSIDEPITWHEPAIPLGSQLYWMLRELDLMWTIRDECLVITTTAETEWKHATQIYDVRNLADPDLGLPGGLETVQTLIEKLVPDSLSAHRGWREVTEFQGLLVVSDAPAVHDAMERLLVALETHCRQRSPAPGNQPWVVPVDPSPAAERIERILGERINVDYCGLPLVEVLRDLAYRLELPVAFDQPALMDVEGYNFLEPVSISAHGRPLVEILDELLAPTQYDFDIRGDVLFFTFKVRRSDAALQTRFYRVNDLLPGYDRSEVARLCDSLVAVQPSYWSEQQGGPGVVLPAGRDWLAVSAPWRKHQEVAEWLKTQRELRGPGPSR